MDSLLRKIEIEVMRQLGGKRAGPSHHEDKARKRYLSTIRSFSCEEEPVDLTPTPSHIESNTHQH